MKVLERTLLKMAMGFAVIFVFRIAAEVGLLSALWRANGVFFRWQVWLLAFVLTLAVRDLVFSLRPPHENRS
jgi:hypothetical protein